MDKQDTLDVTAQLSETRVREIAAEAAGHAVATIVNGRTRALHEHVIAQSKENRDDVAELQGKIDEMVRMFNANILAMDARVRAIEEASR